MLFLTLTLLIPALLVLTDVFLLKNILLTILVFVWMGFCIAFLIPSVRGD